ncbi:VPS9 domain-containing protein [Entamoeba marina]
MDLITTFTQIDKSHLTPFDKHILLFRSLHYTLKSNLLENHSDLVYRCVTELLQLVNIAPSPQQTENDLTSLVHSFLIQLSLYRMMVTSTKYIEEIASIVSTLGNEILYITQGKGILELAIGNPFRGVGENQLKSIQQDEILYSEMAKIKQDYEQQMQNLNQPHQQTNRLEIVQNNMNLIQQNYELKTQATQKQSRAIKRRLQQLDPKAVVSVSSDVDLDLRKLESFVTTLKMPSLIGVLSPTIQTLIGTDVKDIQRVWGNLSKAASNELSKKMFVEQKHIGELDAAIQIIVLDSCSETIIEKYRTEYQQQDKQINRLMEVFISTLHPYHFSVATPFLLSEKGNVAVPYTPVIETFLSGFFTRTKQKAEPLGSEELNPLYTYLLFKSRYNYLYSDSKMIEDFLDDAGSMDRRGHWVSVHLQCLEFLTSLRPCDLNNNLVSSLIANGKEKTVVVIGKNGLGKTTLLRGLGMRSAKTIDESMTAVRVGKMTIAEWDINGDEKDLGPFSTVKNVCGVILCIPSADAYSINTAFAYARPVLNSLKEQVPLLLLLTRHDVYPFITVESFPKITTTIHPRVNRIEYGLCSTVKKYGIYESLMKLRND